MSMSHFHRRGEVADDLRIDERFDPYHFCSAICIMQLEMSDVIYKSVNDLIDIISKPVPVEMREKGFENAKKSDIDSHRHLLTDIWDRVL